MKNDSRFKSPANFSPSDKILTMAAATLAITLAIGAAASSLRAAGISISAFRNNEASTSAAQRKSGGHAQASQQPQSSDGNSAQQGAAMTHAKGTFDVKLEAQGENDKGDGSTMGRMSIDKKFHGELDGTSKGTMLTVSTDTKGSMGYVAIERVTGTLNGKTGSFVLQHSGTLNRGAASQNITVVPDSGTGQLLGITGRFLVIIADGKHSYDFEYALPAAQ